MKKLRVITKSDASILGVKEDSYVEKLVKYIPAEVIAAYTALRAGIIPDKNEITDGLYYGDDKTQLYFTLIFWICLVATPLYKYFSLKDLNLPIPVHQIFISTVAFGFYVFALGDFFEIKLGNSYDPTLAGILLGTFTLFTPIIERLFLINKKE